MTTTFESTSAVFPRLRRLAALTILGVGLVGVTACGAANETPESAATADKAARAEQAGTPGAVLMSALADVTLRPEQKAPVQATTDKLTEQATPVRDARAKIGVELAAEVRAGKIDRAKLQPLVDGMADAAAKTKPALQQAMNELHGQLDAAQRKALVASMRAKFEHVGGGKRGGHGKERMAKIAQELGLTDAQKDAIKDKMKAAMGERMAEHRGEHADHGKMKDKMEAAAAAFESETFDAKALDLGDHGSMMAKHGTEKMLTLIETSMTVLTPEQRNKLADIIVARTQSGED